MYYGRCANGESSRTMPQSRVKEPEIHGLFGEYRRNLNRGGWGGGHFKESVKSNHTFRFLNLLTPRTEKKMTPYVNGKWFKFYYLILTCVFMKYAILIVC